MILQISQVKVPVGYTREDLIRAAAKKLHLKDSEIGEIKIRKSSIDARKKDNIHYSLTVTVRLNGKIAKSKTKLPDISLFKKVQYTIPQNGSRQPSNRPVIIGSGPAGLFAAFLLAKRGLCPLVIERGADVDKRTGIVDKFWETGELSEKTNVQFGEGGAGTFSDGKLNTMVKDTTGRIAYMLETFVEYGADPAIIYTHKPHIGTDVLKTILKNMRTVITELGGEYLFETKMTDIHIEEGCLTGITVESDAGAREIKCDDLILAVGHSSRDTFKMLTGKGVVMEPKPFAVGMRVQHPQKLISINQYAELADKLPAADYKVTHTASNGRGVYSFCMCPGGYVVNASSQKGGTVVNGMSYHDRAGENANSAIIVSVNPDDFDNKDALAGVRFQEKLEKAAYSLAGGKIPVQLFGDFKEKRESTGFGKVKPRFKGEYAFADLNKIFPNYIIDSFNEGMESFGGRIKGFDDPETILAGVEARTSSPLRIVRDKESLMAAGIKGIYPAGEGAGYAGGITSAAVDGIKTAEKIIEKYRPF